MARQDQRADADAVGGKHLFLDAADGQDLAAQGDLAGHGDVAADGAPRGVGRERGDHRDAGGRAVLGDGAGGDVHVDGLALEHLGIDVESLGVGPHVRHGGLGALAHDIAEHPGEDQALLAARHHRDLDEQDVAADRCPGEPGGHARARRALDDLVEEPWAAEVVTHVRRRHVEGAALALRETAGDLARDGGDLAIQVPHARLAGVAPHDQSNGVRLEDQLARDEAVGGELLGDQVLRGDADLLFVRVAGEHQHFHPVAQRPRDGVERVAGGDEEHLRQVERHAEIVVDEGVVLRRVQDLEQRRGRIAAPVGPDLVDLVEHEHGILLLGAPQPLDDAPGERADVGAAMAADLRLVAHAAQRHAHELPAQRARDTLAQAGLAHARRPHEAQDRLARRAVARHARRLGAAAALLAELAHGEVFQDAVLDLVEIEVVLVQHLARAADVDGAAVGLVPRQAHHPFQIGDDHAALRRAGLHARQPLQLALGLPPRLVGQGRLLEAAPQVGHLAVVAAVLAELLLDGLGLLAQDELALLLGEPLLRVARDLPSDLAHGELVLQHVDQPAQLLGHGIHLQQCLPRRRVRADDERRDEVHHLARIGEVFGRDGQLVGQLIGQLHEAAEEIDDGAAQPVQLRAGRRLLGGALDPRDQVRVLGDEVEQPDALDPLHHHAHAAVGRPRHLVDRPHGANAMHVLGGDAVHLFVVLGHEHQQAVAAHDVVDDPDGAAALHEERHGRQREDHGVRERQDGQRVGDREFCRTSARVGGH